MQNTVAFARGLSTKDRKQNIGLESREYSFQVLQGTNNNLNLKHVYTSVDVLYTACSKLILAILQS